MTTAPASAIPWLPKVATGTLAAGVALRGFLLAGETTIGEGLASGLMLLGGGLILADRSRTWTVPARVLAYLIPLALALQLGRQLGHGTIEGFARTANLLALSIAAFALRDLVVSHGAMPLLRRTLVTGGIMLGLFGLAQALYLRPAIAESVLGTGHALEATPQAKAFLMSWRASAVFTSANVFASFLLVTLWPCLLAAGLGRHSRWLLAALGVFGIAALASAGSAGSVAALVLGTAWALALTEGNPLRRVRLRWTAVGLSIAALAIVMIALFGDALSGKLVTLRERLGYWETAIYAFHFNDLSQAKAWVVGGGANSVDPQMVAATAPGAPFSRDPHQSTLAIALEWGIPLAGLLLWIVWRRLATARASCASASGLGASLVVDPARTTVPSNAMAWSVGLWIGATLSVAMQPLISFFPPNAEAPMLVDAMVFAALGVAAWRATRPIEFMTPAFDRALFAGVLAFALHTQLDIHSQIPPVLIAGILAFTALPGHGYCPTTDARSWARLFAVTLGVLAVLGALPLVLKFQAFGP